MTILYWLLLWYFTGVLTCIAMNYYNEEDITLGDVLPLLCVATFGCILTLWGICYLLSKHRDTVIWRFKK